jgi:hypothetical protein
MASSPLRGTGGGRSPSWGDEQEQIRASLDEVTARNPDLKVSAKVASNHGAILRKDFRAIAEAVREVAPLDQGRS